MITCIKRIGIKTVFTMGPLFEVYIMSPQTALQMESLERTIESFKRENAELRQEIKELKG